MAEHPILFSAEMVRAILDGRKTQTRRIIKPQPEREGVWWVVRSKKPMNLPGGIIASEVKTNDELYLRGVLGLIKCPYGKVGDTLWVREAWCYAKMSGYDARDDGGEIWYKATDSGICEGPWKSSRFMFKKFARIFLEITNIRVERVQDISWEDCKSEGIQICFGIDYNNATKKYCAQKLFKDLWNSINIKRGYGWDENPYVWIIEFKRMIFNSEPS